MKVEGNWIIGREEKIFMSIYLNLDYGERQELFEGAELRSRISRQAEWEKHYIKNGSSH